MRGACHTDLLRHQGLVELPAPAPVTDGEHSERPVALGGLVLQPRQLGGRQWRREDQSRGHKDGDDDEQRDRPPRSRHGDTDEESSPWKKQG